MKLIIQSKNPLIENVQLNLPADTPAIENKHKTSNKHTPTMTNNGDYTRLATFKGSSDIKFGEADDQTILEYYIGFATLPIIQLNH